MTRTFGTLKLEPYEDGHRWAIEAQPHVAMRLKRVFPRVYQYRSGVIAVKDTPEIARDLVWLLDRWPLDMTDETRARLEQRDSQFRQREADVEAILAGYQAPRGLTEPARPARDYQVTAADLVLTTGQLLLTDDLGLGKTFSSLLVLRDPEALPALVVTLTHLPQQWLGELHDTLPWLHGHVITSGRVYDPSRRREMHGYMPDVLIINYHKLAKWADHLAGTVRTVIFDEAQELRRHRSDKYAAACRVAFAARYRMGLTATPVYNYAGEIWNVLNAIAPDALGSREEFGREWCRGDGDHLSVVDPAALGLYLREQGLMLRRTRRDVARELPEVTRVAHTIDIDVAELDKLTVDAVHLARTILSDDATNTEKWQASSDFDWRVRHATGLAKADYVARFVEMLLESGEPVVLFGWHRDVYDRWAHLLADHNPAFFTGEESATQKTESTRRFMEGDTSLLVMSLRAGAGLDGLQERAHVAVFGELDWSPGIHDQCIGRLHRDGQDEPVVAYFLIADSGADPVIAEVLNLKRQQSDPIQDPNAPLFKQADQTGDRVKTLAAEFLRRHPQEPLT